MDIIDRLINTYDAPDHGRAARLVRNIVNNHKVERTFREMEIQHMVWELTRWATFKGQYEARNEG